MYDRLRFRNIAIQSKRVNYCVITSEFNTFILYTNPTFINLVLRQTRLQSYVFTESLQL